MATYALIHGAGDVGWYWHLVEAELRERGQDVAVMDLPVDTCFQLACWLPARRARLDPMKALRAE